MFIYQIEYAKSSKSKCKECKESISKSELRIGIIIKPGTYYTHLWHHERCFFKNGKRLGIIQKFKDYNKLAHDDQLRIKGKLVDPSDDSTSVNNFGLNERDKAILSEYSIEESKNSSAICRLCKIKIVKKELRISKIQYEEKCGEIKYYYHIKCFSNVRSEFNIPGSYEHFPGFEFISKQNQEISKCYIGTKNVIPTRDVEDAGPSTSLKIPHKIDHNCEDDQQMPCENENKREYTGSNNNEIEHDTSVELESEAVRIQSQLFHKYKSGLRTLSRQDLEIICKRNHLFMFKGSQEPLDLLADCMAFGALQPCPKCNGQLKLNTFFYECTGFISEYSLCKYRTKSPERVPFIIPAELKHYSALKDYEPSVGQRVFSDEPSDFFQPSPPKRIKVEHVKPPLKNLLFYIHGFNREDKETIKCRLLKLGGCVANKLVETVAAVVATKEQYHKKTHLAEHIKLGGFHVVETWYLDEIESSQNSLSVPEAIKLIEEHNISEYSSDIYSRVPRQVVDGEPVRVSAGGYVFKSDNPGISTLKVKDGTPLVKSGLEDSAHVYREGGEVYSATLSRVYIDPTQGSNNFYTLQLLVADMDKRFCVMRSCGATGSEPKHFMKEFQDLGEAKAFFKDVFHQKTGNTWSARHHFQKQCGKFELIKMADFSEVAPEELQLDSQSELPSSVQRLIILLFDINIINKTILDIDIDTNKMPLGMPSQGQISDGFNILQELYNALTSGAVDDFIVPELSTRFYTKIPHKGEPKELTLLDNVDLVMSKMMMLDDLSNTHISYKILHEEMDMKISLMDQYYLKLKTEIVTLETDSPEYATVLQYFTNTHSPEHSFKMEVEQIFKVEREGEAQRFESSASLHNVKLLWHGSRLSNMAGILLQGLLIAPEGVKLTGAMFGKGIYFADLVSKSAHYTYTTPAHPRAVLLLCRVALGNMERCTGRITELPEGMNSVWGVGRLRPDPASTEFLPDGTEVPLGVVVPNTDDDPDELALIHNEYIVYDAAQVNINYLVQFHIHEM